MKLKEYRKTHGVKQAEIARTLGITQSRVSELENGGTPSLDLALRIEELTGGAVRPGDWIPVQEGAAPEVAAE